jgi:O-succinylbenzoic acid--CoA ligase
MYTTYGLTEMASQVTTTAPNATQSELRTAGRVLPGRELMIGSGDEILVRGETLFLGYYHTDHLDRPLDDAGWFATGDRGALTSEGFLTVTGRCDQMFISGGENIFPEEIEQALLGLSSILQSIVVAVPDAEFGQRPVAFVQSTEFQPTEWRRQLAEQLPGFKIPKLFLPWPESTASTSLKPSRRHLQLLAQRHVTSAAQPTSPKSSTAP